MSGWVSSPSTATLSPLSTLKTPSGSPASFHSSAIHSAAVGTFSLGLSTTVLPAAMAIGKNHIGTMAGKLNGLMIATTPSGWRTECTSTPVEAFSVNAPLSRCGMPQANSTTSWPRVTSPERVGEHLAVFGRDDRRKLALAGVQQLAEGEQDLGALGQGRVPPGRGRPRFAAATATRRSSSAEASGSWAVTPPVAGSVTSEKRPLGPRGSAPSIQWVQGR